MVWASNRSGAPNEGPPFFSPDGAWIGFWDGNEAKLKKVPLEGGLAVTICDLPNVARARATWGDDGSIVVASGGDLFKVPASGGTLQLILKGDTDGPFEHRISCRVQGPCSFDEETQQIRASKNFTPRSSSWRRCSVTFLSMDRHHSWRRATSSSSSEAPSGPRSSTPTAWSLVDRPFPSWKALPEGAPRRCSLWPPMGRSSSSPTTPRIQGGWCGSIVSASQRARSRRAPDFSRHGCRRTARPLW